jgi:hypothetical protein
MFDDLSKDAPEDSAIVPRVCGVGRAGADMDRKGALVFLSFVPTDDQLTSINEHMKSWVP